MDQAKAAFKKLALRLHPDKNRAPDAAEQFRAVSEAFEAVMRAGSRGEEAEELLRDPLADFFGEGWARGFADGSLDPKAVLTQAREKAAAQLGGVDIDPLEAAAAEMGLNMDPESLRQLLEGVQLDGMPTMAAGLEGLSSPPPFGAGLSLPEIPAEMFEEGSDGNPFKVALVA